MTIEGPVPQHEEPLLVERGETGVRILFSVLFAIIFRLASTVLLVVVIFELLYTLVTRQPPRPRVRGFANRTLSYMYEITRYLTYNRAGAPFPLADFPPEVAPVPDEADLVPEEEEEELEALEEDAEEEERG